MASSNKWQAWLLLIILSCIWGSSFILIKRGLDAFTAHQVGALRLFTASLVLLPLAFRHFGSIPAHKLIPIFLVGLIGSGLPAFLFAIAQTVVSSATAGILNALTPIFTLLIGALFFQVKWLTKKFIGILVGLTGAYLILSYEGTFSLNFRFGLLVLIATICYAISTNIIKTYLQEIDPIKIVTIAFTFLLIPSAIYLYASGFLLTMSTEPLALNSFIYIFILALNSRGKRNSRAIGWEL